MGRYTLILFVVVLFAATVTRAEASYIAGQEAYRVQSYSEAMREFMAENSPRCWYMVGVLYENGEGVDQDPKQAAEWYQRAADAGYAPAQFRLGKLYLDGKGVDQDRNQALKLYKQAAAQGYDMARYELKTLQDGNS